MLTKLGKDSVIYGGSDFFIKLISFFTFPLIATTLTPANFGTLELITTLVGLLGLFMNCGVNNAVQRFYWDQDITEEQRSPLVSSGLALQLMFWIALSAVLFLMLPIIEIFIDISAYGFSYLAFIAALVLVYVTQATQYIQDVIRLHFKPLQFFIFSFCGRSISAIAALIVVVGFAGGIDGLLATQAAIGLLALPLGLYFIRQEIKASFDKEQAKNLLSFGAPFIFMGMAYWVFSSTDRWMLSALSSIEETGQYSVAFRFASIVFFISTAFGQAWSPYAIKVKADSPNTYRKKYADIFIVLVFVMLIVGGGLALFSGEIIGVVMTPEYYPSALAFAILAFAIIMQSTQQITAIGISLEKRTSLFAKISWVAAVLNVAGNYVLIPQYGATGAAIATFLSYLFITGCYLFYTQRLHALHITWHKLIGLCLLGSCVLAVAIIFNTTDLNIEIILSKLGFAAFCLGCGYFLLPRKDVLNDP